MVTAREVSTALYGAYRLARLDRGGMAYFDTSLAGFWKSFHAAVIIAPFYGALLLLRLGSGEVTTNPLQYLLVESIQYVILWVAFPLVMVAVCDLLDRRKNYIPFVVAYNWASIPQNALFLPISFLAQAGVLSQGAGDSLQFVVLALVLVYTWFITRTALDIPSFTAVSLVIMELLLAMFIGVFATSLL
jgi:hypothetical protein